MYEALKTFNDPRWVNLIKSFEDQIKEDKKYFNCRSTYVELPEICPQPEFCLIGMEPGHGKDPNEPEYRNFIANKRDFILNYCAYRYLGEEGFNYQITDMAKGGIEIEDAKKTRAERYRIWLPLLRNELELLGNPKIIFIGKGLYCLNCQEKYFPHSEVNFVLHHSTQNGHINSYFESIPNDRKHGLPKKEEVEEIAGELMIKQNYSDKLKKKF